MLTKLTLKNWQCWQSLEIELGQVTVLTGDNDVGKSAVLRALRWLVLNEWEGKADEHITWGREASEVSAEIDGRTVSRRKGKGINSYSLDGQDSPGIGKIVPEPISRLFNLTAGNFADQDDPAFWIVLSPPAAAQALNDLFNLGEIDSTASRIAQELRGAKALAEASERRLEAARGQEMASQWIRTAHRELAEIETLVQQKVSLDQMIATFQAVETELAEVEEGLKGLAELLVCSSSALQSAALHEALRVETEGLRSILAQEDELCQSTKRLKQKEILLHKWLAGTCPMCGRSP